MTAIERRIFSGVAENADVEWLEFLSDVFRTVPLSGFVHNGMTTEHARRLVNVLAMANRMCDQKEQPE